MKTLRISQGGQDKSTEEKFLLEIKEQYDRDLDLRDTLDNKADKMTAVASAIATLLVGLGTFLVSRLKPGNLIFSLDILALLFGVAFAAVSIWFFISAFRGRTFHFPFLDDKFFKENGLVNEDNLQKIIRQVCYEDLLI